jgi:hypothetical protein
VSAALGLHSAGARLHHHAAVVALLLSQRQAERLVHRDLRQGG